MKKILGLTIGDPAGIGPEISLKAIHLLIKQGYDFYPILIGDIAVLKKNIGILGKKFLLESWKENTVPQKGITYYISPGIITGENFIVCRNNNISGKASYEYFKLGWKLLKEKKISCLVTSPISKTSWQLADIKFSGHTEALKSFSGEDVKMLMVANNLRVLLITTHIPLKEIWNFITVERISESIIKAEKFIRKFFSKKFVKIGMCGLNPHAGESGYLGLEEKEILIPAIKKIKNSHINIEGPYPSDAIFRKAINEKCFDLIVALYHDQALIPLKTFFFNKLVNVSINSQNWIRTSPGHGTAHDIAYKGKADPSSTVEAIKLSLKMAKRI